MNAHAGWMIFRCPFSMNVVMLCIRILGGMDMRNLLLCIFLALVLSGCETTGENQKDNETVKKKSEIETGWSGNDTYTVRVIAENRPVAIEKAKQRILRDIVNVRMLNQSPFTDIRKIRNEFQKPMDEGEIIWQRPLDGQLEVFYQIKEKGLKDKFRRK